MNLIESGFIEYTSSNADVIKICFIWFKNPTGIQKTGCWNRKMVLIDISDPSSTTLELKRNWPETVTVTTHEFF